MKLKDMAVVSSAGVIKYEDLKVDKFDKEVVLLTGANISELGCLSLIADKQESNLRKVFVEEELFQSKKLDAGDIVFMSRGSSLRAVIVREEDLQFDLLPSPNFLIIKAKSGLVLPEIIVAFLNSVLGQQVLDRLTTGAALKNVPVGKLKDIDFVLPTQESQDLLAALFYKNIDALKAIDELYLQQVKTFQAALNQLIGRQ